MDKAISCISLEHRKLNSYKTKIKALDLTFKHTLKKGVVVYYNVIIPYERY